MTPPVSTCVDCRTPIIGERLRCPACHDAHAEMFDVDVDVDVVAPQREGSALQILLSWMVAAEVIAAILFGVVITVRGC